MKIIGIKEIIRKDVPIYYKRFYKGILTLDLMNKAQDSPLEFIIEHKPTGQTEITVTHLDEVDYPVVPLMRELKNFINELDASRKLPI
ncbi:MAG: hypothetical protein LBI14_08980 [Treponema sp.]|jgi:hypothetical protein|nr:hypothetical protein [Treponema sp.]